MPTRQKIIIEVTWDGWSKLRLNTLIAWLANLDNLEIKRITVSEPK